MTLHTLTIVYLFFFAFCGCMIHILAGCRDANLYFVSDYFRIPLAALPAVSPLQDLSFAGSPRVAGRT